MPAVTYSWWTVELVVCLSIAFWLSSGSNVFSLDYCRLVSDQWWWWPSSGDVFPTGFFWVDSSTAWSSCCVVESVVWVIAPTWPDDRVVTLVLRRLCANSNSSSFFWKHDWHNWSSVAHSSTHYASFYISNIVLPPCWFEAGARIRVQAWVVSSNTLLLVVNKRSDAAQYRVTWTLLTNRSTVLVDVNHTRHTTRPEYKVQLGKIRRSIWNKLMISLRTHRQGEFLVATYFDSN